MLLLDLPGSKTDQTKAFEAEQFECGFEGNLRLMLLFFYRFLNNYIILIIYIRSCQKAVKRRTQDDIIWKLI